MILQLLMHIQTQEQQFHIPQEHLQQQFTLDRHLPN